MVVGLVEFVLLLNTNGKQMLEIISSQNTFLEPSHTSAHFVERPVAPDKAWKIIKESTKKHKEIWMK